MHPIASGPLSTASLMQLQQSIPGLTVTAIMRLRSRRLRWLCKSKFAGMRVHSKADDASSEFGLVCVYDYSRDEIGVGHVQ